jgi:eukaryotic-like serine/threonine-protein kinase
MIGTRVANYEITAHLGSGGMGEVYCARDVRLGRSVALKMLPDLFARDAERVSRFEREAIVLASLNHANIAALHGIEQSGDRRFLVMELVEGETLGERINRGPIPVEEALKIALQIVDALEAAHQKGIVHRDLKPANVKITPEGKVKVLDFGLAKAFESGPAASDILSSPTMSVLATNAGIILGTAGYMSPEQAKGATADPRSDIFSFGSVLFEMLTGQRAFQGDSVSELIASVLAREPDWNLLPANLHPRIPELIRRCLEKDRKRRWQAIGDVRFELEAIVSDPHGLKLRPAAAAAVPLWKRVLPAAATGIVAVLLTAAVIWNMRAVSPPVAITRFSFDLPKDQAFTRTGRHAIAISQDGANVVYAANLQLYLRNMAESEAKPVPGTMQDINTPFFSPDGKWIGFYAVPEGKLKKIAVTGGASVTLADLDNVYGVHWYSQDQMLVGQGNKGIVRVSAVESGKPETVVTVKADEFAQSPQLLPGGDGVLFTLASGTDEDRWDKAQIVLQSLKTGDRKTLIQGGTDARYIQTGHIVYALGGTVFAVPFDVKKFQVMGGPVPIVEGVMRATVVNTGAANFATANNGSLVFVHGDPGAVQGDRVLALVDPGGAKKAISVPAASYFNPRISPDGKQLAVQQNSTGSDVNIWIYDLAGATSMRRLTFGGANQGPLWTPDSQRIVFQSDREGDNGLFWQRADGSGSAERLTKPEKGILDFAEAWSPDGKTLIFTKGSPGNRFNLWMFPMDGNRQPKPLIEVPKSNQGRASFSPDGRWIAYQSTESGTQKVYVQPFPPTGAKYQVTTELAESPLWAPDGKQLFYVSPIGNYSIVSRDVQTQPNFTFGSPKQVVGLNGFQANGPGRPYDMTPDGKHFILLMQNFGIESGDTRLSQINVVLNWFEELTQRVPVK